MDLQNFLPYRLAVVAEAVSRSVAAVYRERFELTRDEWRVLAQLAGVGELKSSELGALTTLDKMQVSRAVTRMEQGGLVEREPDPADRRNLRVRLTPAGRVLYRKIVPMAQARERFLLDALSNDECEALRAALDRIEQRARQLTEQG